MEKMDEKKRKIIKIAVIVILCLIFLFSAAMLIKDYISEKSRNDIIDKVKPNVTETEKKTDTPESVSQPDETNKPEETEPEITKEPYVSPVDFKTLADVNTDIYAWIKIPDTIVDFPVVQSPTSNAFYLDHDFKKNYYAGGSIYTEKYNTRTFDDRVTVIYGHNMYNAEAMFGTLINYSDRNYFDSHNKMTIYMPDKEIEYTLVGAIPYNNKHLMVNWDPQNAFGSFWYDLTKNVNGLAILTDDYKNVGIDDKIVILSTCYYSREDMRFLLVWRETGRID